MKIKILITIVVVAVASGCKPNSPPPLDTNLEDTRRQDFEPALLFLEQTTDKIHAQVVASEKELAQLVQQGAEERDIELARKGLELDRKNLANIEEKLAEWRKEAERATR